MTMRMETLADGRVRIEAPAKVNLGLRVFPVRADGFHDLETWMSPLSWHDTVTVGGEGKLVLEVTGRTEGVPTEAEKNLVGRAALKLAAAAGIEARGSIVLHKVLPPGGGLGGGSSDGANVLVALNEAWGLKWELERLLPIAAELGSDVPFFVPGVASLCTGRGELMTELRGRGPLYAVLILPPFGCPTKEVFAAFDAGGFAGKEGDTDWRRIARAGAEEMLELLMNDLEEPAFSVAPPLKALRDLAAEIAGRRVCMTGSGSTLFTLCASGAEAEEMRGKLERELSEEVGVVAAQVMV